jgi:glycosyltransferase involved in cell wall biosynthesis
LSTKRTLVATLPPMTIGGVTSKARLLVEALRRAGHDVTVAHYALNAAGVDPMIAFGGVPTVPVRCVGGVLEQRYTAPSPQWRRLIDAHDYHVAVGGTVLIANPLAAAGVRHLIWCAADLEGDRSFRQRAMPWWRRLGDSLLVMPALRRQQEAVLRADNRIFGVSQDAVLRLRRLAQGRDADIQRMTIPVDTAYFTPNRDSHSGLRIGFAGRLDDPRKNAPLLFAALAALRADGAAATLTATGTETPELTALARRYGVGDAVTFTGVLDLDRLRAFYRGLDVFVIASLQEGLAIAGLEAMACGVPVVSTRCGGPEDYVRDGENGRLCGFDAKALAEAIARTAVDEDWKVFSANARATVEREFAMQDFYENLDGAWHATWGERP